MAIEVTCIDPERPDFGARVTGLDIAAGVSPEETQQVEAAIARTSRIFLDNPDLLV